MLTYLILPIERYNAMRGPKYLRWQPRPDAPGIACWWSLIDYGCIDWAAVAADLTAEQRTTLAGYSDVYLFPDNLDTTMPAKQVNALKSMMEGAWLPAQWMTTSNTYRVTLRTIVQIMLAMQAISGRLGYDPSKLQGIALNDRFDALSAEVQAAITAAGYAPTDTSTTLRTLIKTAADAWGSTPIQFGASPTLGQITL